MNRISSILAMFAVLALFAFSTPAVAHEGHHMPGEKVVTKTITGEVVDMGCWLGHAARGEKHISCATKCLNQGIPSITTTLTPSTASRAWPGRTSP